MPPDKNLGRISTRSRDTTTPHNHHASPRNQHLIKTQNTQHATNKQTPTHTKKHKHPTTTTHKTHIHTPSYNYLITQVSTGWPQGSGLQIQMVVASSWRRDSRPAKRQGSHTCRTSPDAAPGEPGDVVTCCDAATSCSSSTIVRAVQGHQHACHWRASVQNY